MTKITPTLYIEKVKGSLKLYANFGKLLISPDVIREVLEYIDIWLMERNTRNYTRDFFDSFRVTNQVIEITYYDYFVVIEKGFFSTKLKFEEAKKFASVLSFFLKKGKLPD